MIRHNPLTGDPVLYAPDRAARPHSPSLCPFCPGHEAETPPELAHIGDPWRVRAFPNKYPPIEGAEVIVEAPHEESTSEELLQLCASRLDAHRSAEYVSLFRNEGARAGATIAHPHAQLIPLPFLPPRIERELAGFADSCPLCTPSGAIIRATPSFTWIAPHASAFAYQSWIVPRHHTPTLPDAYAELAELLRAATHASLAVAPAFNWMFVTFPRESRGHFYIDIVPRTATIAGFELGTGTFVEIVDPERAAVTLGARA